MGMEGGRERKKRKWGRGDGDRWLWVVTEELKRPWSVQSHFMLFEFHFKICVNDS